MNTSLESLPGEIWKEIPGYGGMYKASNIGRILSFKKSKPKIITGRKDKDGYIILSLSNNGNKKNRSLASLVALCFIGSYPKGTVLCHKNGIRTDNVVENLEYKTQKQNIYDKFKHGTILFGEKIKTSKLKDHQVLIIRRLRSKGSTISELANKFGVCIQTIWDIIDRDTWKHI